MANGTRGRTKSDPGQYDMFEKPVYPARTAATRIDREQFQRDLARALKRAADASELDRYEIAKRMAVVLDLDDFSKATLDAYTSEAKESHRISIERLLAFVMVTGQSWLMDFLANMVGCTVLVGEESNLAEIALLEQEKTALDARLKKLKARPVRVSRRRSAK